MTDLTHLIKAATQFVNTHPSHPRFDPSQQPQMETSQSDHLMDVSHQHAEHAANLPPIHGGKRPTDTEIALALLPALLGQNPKYLGGLLSGYHHSMGEELAHQHADRHDQQVALMNLSHHYSDSAKSAHTDEMARFSESGRNYRSSMSNQRLEDTAHQNAQRIQSHANAGHLSPEQSAALHQFNVNMQGIADGPEGWTTEHQNAYEHALDHLRHLDIFEHDPHVIDSLVKSFPIGYKSTKAVAMSHETYHKFLSSIYHPGTVTEMDVRRSHMWLNKNVPEGFRWQFIIPQEGESWQSVSQRLNHAQGVRDQRSAGQVQPMTPKLNGNDWTSAGPIGPTKRGTLPRVRRY